MKRHAGRAVYRSAAPAVRPYTCTSSTRCAAPAIFGVRSNAACSCRRVAVAGFRAGGAALYHRSARGRGRWRSPRRVWFGWGRPALIRLGTRVVELPNRREAISGGNTSVRGAFPEPAQQAGDEISQQQGKEGAEGQRPERWPPITSISRVSSMKLWQMPSSARAGTHRSGTACRRGPPG